MQNLSLEKIKELKIKANNIRKNIIEMLYKSQSGHTAGPLGMADIFTYLYFVGMKYDKNNPKWEERDRLVLSNGHICPVLYATFAEIGYLKKEELWTLRKFGSKLQGHPHREFLPILETASGPLGEGLSQAVGMAIATKIDNGVNKNIFCIVGDGELNEGQNWEAIMLGAKENLGNLTLIVDRNNIQLDGNTEDIMPLNNLRIKFGAFNWHTEEVDGHDFVAIHNAIEKVKEIKDKPSVIIANTIPCKGVKEWERDYRWHGKAPNKEEYELAINELSKIC